MWQHVFRPHVKHDRDRFVIAPHHPDRLRRPPAPLGAVSDERFQQALVWNIFRTLELVSPSFWLRRFQIRLTGEPSVVPPQIATVHLWQHLLLPPIQRIDGERPTVVADVVIETEHAVWTLIAESASRNLTDSENAAAIVDAGSWFAGVRQHHVGVIESTASSTSPGSVLQTRYSRSRDSVRLRSSTRGPAASTHVQWGGIRWSELAALLEDCREAANLPPIERALARNALEWLKRAGG
jgi:hypothetical protein